MKLYSVSVVVDGHLASREWFPTAATATRRAVELGEVEADGRAAGEVTMLAHVVGQPSRSPRRFELVDFLNVLETVNG